MDEFEEFFHKLIKKIVKHKISPGLYAFLLLLLFVMQVIIDSNVESGLLKIINSVFLIINMFVFLGFLSLEMALYYSDEKYPCLSRTFIKSFKKGTNPRAVLYSILSTVLAILFVIIGYLLVPEKYAWKPEGDSYEIEIKQTEWYEIDRPTFDNIKLAPGDTIVFDWALGEFQVFFDELGLSFVITPEELSKEIILPTNEFIIHSPRFESNFVNANIISLSVYRNTTFLFWPYLKSLPFFLLSGLSLIISFVLARRVRMESMKKNNIILNNNGEIEYPETFTEESVRNFLTQYQDNTFILKKFVTGFITRCNKKQDLKILEVALEEFNLVDKLGEVWYRIKERMLKFKRLDLEDAVEREKLRGDYLEAQIRVKDLEKRSLESTREQEPEKSEFEKVLDTYVEKTRLDITVIKNAADKLMAIYKKCDEIKKQRPEDGEKICEELMRKLTEEKIL